MLNRCEFIGNLGRDPEVRRLASGDPVVSLRLAVSEAWKDKATGERKERTEWVQVVIFNEHIAKVAETYLRKGSKVFVAGAMQTRKWQDQSGEEKFTTEIVLQRFRGELTLLDGKSEGGEREPRQQEPAASSSAAGSYAADLDDDIPFEMSWK